MPRHAESVHVEELHPLPAEFFARDPREVAPELLGALVVSSVAGQRAGGRVVETEAYLGVGDPGSHAATKSITKRNVVLYGPAGSVYVYFSYGNHYMLNIVCCPEGEAGAVLIRAIEPLIGIDVMAKRRGDRPVNELANGPGKVCAALGVDLSDNTTMLGCGRLVVYDYPQPRSKDVAVTGRIGLSAGHELALRYYLRGNQFVSRGQPGVSTKRA